MCYVATIILCLNQHLLDILCCHESEYGFILLIVGLFGMASIFLTYYFLDVSKKLNMGLSAYIFVIKYKFLIICSLIIIISNIMTIPIFKYVTRTIVFIFFIPYSVIMVICLIMDIFSLFKDFLLTI